MGIRVLPCCFLLQNTDYKNSLLFTPFSATRFAMHRIYANRINSRSMSRVFCDLRSQKTPRGILPVNSNIKYASRILLIIAAVVKVLCKHRLWLVAHVKKLPSETLLFMFRTTAIFCESKQNDKPGYVLNGHLSNPAVASRLQRPT